VSNAVLADMERIHGVLAVRYLPVTAG
jgi:hypothetical protein